MGNNMKELTAEKHPCPHCGKTIKVVIFNQDPNFSENTLANIKNKGIILLMDGEPLICHSCKKQVHYR